MQDRDIDTISPYPDNAKKHPAKQIGLIAKSIQEFGFNQPIVVDKKGVIIVGHGRYLAAKSLGMENVPTMEIDITEEKANAYRLADNKLNESDWDMELAIGDLKDMSREMFDLTGFDRVVLEDGEDVEGEIDFTTELLEENNYIVVVFDNVIDWQTAEAHFGLETVKALDSKKGYERKGVGRVVKAKKLLDLL